MVRVRLYGGAQKLAGRDELELEVPAGARLSDVLQRVAGPEGLPEGSSSAILINGRNCAFRQGPATPIADGDLIEILPIVTGG